jgi:hypothetical protein
VYLHIGPYKTGTSHVQSFFHANRHAFKEHNLCWPGGDRLEGVQFDTSKLFISLVRRVIGVEGNGDLSPFHSGFEECFSSGMNIFASSEAFSVFNPKDLAKFAEFLKTTAKGKQFEVKVIVTYREWLRHTYSTYSEREKTEGKVFGLNSFAEFLVFPDVDYRKTLDRTIQVWVNQFGAKNVKILDYYGVEASHKDINHIIICEIMGTMCGKFERLTPSKSDNKQVNQVYLHYMHTFDNFLNGHYMKVCNPDREYQSQYVYYLSSKDIKFPVRESNLDLFKMEQIRVKNEFYDKFGDLILYKNSTANDEMIKSFSIQMLDVNKLYEDVNWINFLYSERKRLVESGKICSIGTGNKVTSL